jgi:thioredoxin 1
MQLAEVTPMQSLYTDPEPARSAVDAMHGPAVIEFGAAWCPICQAAQPLIDAAFAAHPDLRRLQVEDGKGRPLGRSFGIKLWPTLVFLHDGKEVAREVRPRDAAAIGRALDRIDPR